MSHRCSLSSKLALAAGACLASLLPVHAEVGVSGAYTMDEPRGPGVSRDHAFGRAQLQLQWQQRQRRCRLGARCVVDHSARPTGSRRAAPTTISATSSISTASSSSRARQAARARAA